MGHFKTYRVHPLAQLFPRICGEEFAALKADIAEHGQRRPVIQLADGLILDGRNRLVACKELGIDPVFAEWQPAHDGDTPEAFIISENLHRRHLTDGQRSMIAAWFANHPGAGTKGVPTRAHGNKDDGHVTMADAARMLNVTVPRVESAREVINHGTPEEIEAVASGQEKVGKVRNDILHRRGRITHHKRSPDTPGPGPDKPIAFTGESLAVNPSEVRHLVGEIRDFIDSVHSRRREVATITREERIALALEFAQALGVAPGRTEERSGIGSAAGHAAASA